MEDFRVKTGFLDRHSRRIHIAITILLVALCTASYVLLILLFTSPQVFRITSLVNHEDSRVSPTVAIPLLVAVLSGCTIALVTRAVEQNLWLKLIDKPGNISANEAHRLAQWSVSTLGRLIYTLSGRSWTLRITALLLVGCTILSPVLLYGVTPRQVNKSSESQVAMNKTAFVEFENMLGGNDLLTPFAALLATHGMSSSGSSLCRNASCTVHARAFSVRASCKAWEIHSLEHQYASCSHINKAQCVSFNAVDTIANFTTGVPPECELVNDGINYTVTNCPGEFATIFGLFEALKILGPSSLQSIQPAYAVDCRLQFGNVSITQVGNGAPVLLKDSFEKSKDSFQSVTSPRDILGLWQMSYVAPQYVLSNSSFDFVIPKQNRPTPIANALLDFGPDLFPLVTGEEAAANIEATFAMLTLLTYSKYPQTASATITTTTSHLVWNYNSWVLPILVLPLLASIIVLSTNSEVGAIETVIGYDPVRIAKSAEKVLLGVNDTNKSAQESDSMHKIDDEEGNREDGATSVTSNLLGTETQPGRFGRSAQEHM